MLSRTSPAMRLSKMPAPTMNAEARGGRGDDGGGLVT